MIRAWPVERAMVTGPRLVPGGDPWLFAICLSRVGAFMVYIAYAATLPVLQREWHMSATAAGSAVSLSA